MEQVKNRADLARHIFVSRAMVTEVLSILNKNEN